MKKLTFITFLALFHTVTLAQNTINVQNKTMAITNKVYGSGNNVVRNTSVDSGLIVNDNIYHVPQYMPHHPTAATLWPRVIEVDCIIKDKSPLCDGYHTFPQTGRTEYLFFTPRFKEEPVPIVVTQPPKEVEKTVIVEKPVVVEKTVIVEKPVVVYKEVLPKKIKE